MNAKKFIVLGWNDSAKFAGSASELYSEGICSCCCCGKGKRTNTPIVCASFPRTDLWSIESLEPMTPVVSEKLQEMLQEGSDGNIIFREIIGSKASKKRFFEVINNSEIDKVAVDGMFSRGLECPDCGRRNIINLRPNLGGMVTAIRHSDIPKAHAFIIGKSSFVPAIVVDKVWWDNVREEHLFRGILASPAIVVEDEQIIFNPKLGIYEKE